VTNVEALAVHGTASRPEITTRTVIRQQSQRFNGERLGITNVDQ
jgi:hypothetical protein